MLPGARGASRGGGRARRGGGTGGGCVRGGNGKVAFFRNGDVWTMNADGSGPANLTNTPSTNDEVEPAWSPDGTKIAYTRIGCEPERRGAHCVFVMNADGSGQTNLTPEDELSQCPNSPGYYFNGASRSPAWSPDGGKIAFASDRSGNFEIYRTKAAPEGRLNKPVNLSKNPAGDYAPTWPPDGRKIAFTSERAARLRRQDRLGDLADEGHGRRQPDEPHGQHRD